MKPISECRTVAELLESPERWCQKVSARDAFGNSGIIIESPDACSFCLWGALARVHGWAQAWMYRKEIERDYIKGHLSIGAWNDDPSRTHSEVLALVKELNL